MINEDLAKRACIFYKLPQTPDNMVRVTSDNEYKKIYDALLYFEECRKAYNEHSSRRDVSQKREENLRSLISNKFSLLDDVNDFVTFLRPTFNLIEQEWRNPSPKIARLTEEGFSLYDGPSLRNVTYVSYFDKVSIDGIRIFLMNSGIKEILERYYLSRIGVCNVRAWRFAHNPAPENIHIDEAFQDSFNQNPHKDGLLPGTIKIMIYRNPIGDSLTLEDGATEVLVGQEWLSATGMSPIGIIFEPNELLHRAFRPAAGRVRDALELTIIPKLEDDFLVISSGAHAGHPLNLDTHWSRRQVKENV